MDGQGIGVWLGPGADGMVRVYMSEGLWTAIAATGFIGAAVAGLVTAWLLLP